MPSLLLPCFAPHLTLTALRTCKQDSVGIRHGGHCNKIVDHLREQLEKDPPTILKPVKHQLTLCVEGNISTGKSSFLQLVGEMQNLQVCTYVASELIHRAPDINRSLTSVLPICLGFKDRFSKLDMMPRGFKT